MRSDECPETETKLLFNIQDTEDIVIGFGIGVHVGAGTLLIRVDNDFAPVFRNSAFGA